MISIGPAIRLCIIGLIVALISSCGRSKLRAKVVHINRGQDVPVNEAISSVKTYLQTSTTFQLEPSPEFFEPGDSFSLFNKSNKQMLVEREMAYTSDAEAVFSLLENNLTLSSVTLKIYLQNDDFKQRSAVEYGKSNFELKVFDDSGGIRKTAIEIVRKDFPFFSMMNNGFVGTTLARPTGLEVEISNIGGNVLTNGQHTLILGSTTDMLSW